MTSTPLTGRTVVVTRARAQAAELIDGLAVLGAEVLAFPTIRTCEPSSWAEADAAIARLADYDWVVFTSANAVRSFEDRLRRHGMDLAVLRDKHIAAIGPATAARLEQGGVFPELVPDEHRAEGVLEGFVERGVGHGSRVLLPRALEARDVIPDGLRERGATVDVVAVYRTVAGEGDPAVLARLASGGADVIIFTSPSTVANFLELTRGIDRERAMHSVVTASIGPVTSDALRDKGLGVDVEAPDSTMDGLVAAIAAHFA